MNDEEIAKDLRAKMTALLLPVCHIVSKAKREGYLITYTTSEDQSGNHIISKIDIQKKL